MILLSVCTLSQLPSPTKAFFSKKQFLETINMGSETCFGLKIVLIKKRILQQISKSYKFGIRKSFAKRCFFLYKNFSDRKILEQEKSVSQK